MSEAKTYYQVVRNFHNETTPEPITVKFAALEVAIRAFERHKISFPKHRIQLISVEVLRESHVFEGVDEDRDIPLRATAPKPWPTPFSEALPGDECLGGLDPVCGPNGEYNQTPPDVAIDRIKRVDRLTTTEAIVKRKKRKP